MGRAATGRSAKEGWLKMVGRSSVSDAGRAALRALGIALGSVMVSACATLQAGEAAKAEPSAAATVESTGKPGATPAPAAPKPAAGAAAPAAATPPTPPGAPRPFAEIVKDAKVVQGLFPVWQKDDKAWIEIPADMLDKPFFLSINMSRGIGERMLIAGLMGSRDWYATGGEYVAEFRKAGGNIQLIARNTTFVARAGSPEERAVRKSFSDSLLSSAPVASAPHPERKSVLVEVNALLTVGYSARVMADRTQLSKHVQLRRAQLVYRVGKEQPGAHGIRHHSALFAAAHSGSATAADRTRRAAGAVLSAACGDRGSAQLLPRFPVFVHEASRAANGRASG